VCIYFLYDRKNLPTDLTATTLSNGQVVARRRGNVMVVKYKRRRDVLCMSSRHTGRLVTAGGRARRGAVKKPDLILDHDRFMASVDRNDEPLSFYSPLCKSLKWYRKVVFHMLDMCTWNAYVVYKHLGGPRTQAWFRRQVIHWLVSPTPAVAQQRVPNRPLGHHKCSDMSRLVVGRGHFLAVISPSEGAHRKLAPTKACVLCTKNGRRRESRYLCETCDSTPALCITPCFKIFHTKVDL